MRNSPSFDVDHEAHLFAAANGLGNAGVKVFHSAYDRLGSGVPLTEIRLEALRAYEESKKETEVIVNSSRGKVISMLDCEPAERPVQSQQFRPDEDEDPRPAA
jgi:hypothetical protein